ncbi:MAG: Uma2 family endonuclease [Saprospiraceae bacterium]|nr:Uma2 family endonuclease [Saprospiraceae bacterium]MCF8252661.1 Uma2 family endonuclease [Saprospiraceae bacterium]MCF8282860.1 Uma2 family endonuclease [Bacteroidales bacterium]MCF8314233.1 Uma2 family endonuclease [Saprospiraceae bacterium]MCF8443048.1 Uma2 family endonuclease [Saprospiraceae bacterium]
MEIVAKGLTYQEFKQLEFADDDTSWYELINGELVRKQSPTIRHQGISGNIYFRIRLFVEKKSLGKVFSAPLDTVLDDGNSYHPDVLFVSKDRFHILDEKEEVVIGAPDLVVEILSKGTAIYDRGDKKDIYEKYGVREYWLVDPKSKTVEVYSFEKERFKLKQYAEETGVIKSTVLKGFKIELEKIFEE